MSYHKPTQQRYFKTEKGKAAIRRYESSDKRRRERQNTRKKNHQSCREQDNARSKAYYKIHDKYFKLKNKEWNEKNGNKWKERRAKISLEWTMNKCSSALVEKTFENLGASLTVEQEITFPQLCSLLKVLGYDPKEVTYPAFVNRYNYFNKKRTP